VPGAASPDYAAVLASSLRAMGTVCARCADVKKAKGALLRPDGEASEEEGSEGGSKEDDDHVELSSEESGSDEEYRRTVKETLKSNGKSLKRGKTMAMKEAITTAKKCNIEASAITEAEKQLRDHKRQQRREEAERAVAVFFGSPAVRERAAVEAMLKRAAEADCKKEVLAKLQAQLDEIIISRDLEDEEVEQARELMKESCRGFVLGATKPGGRPVLLLDLSSGVKIPSRISLDPPLQNLGLRQETAAEGAGKKAPLRSLTVKVAKDDKTVKSSSGFNDLEDGESECAVAVRYESSQERGVWCFVEPTPERRDRLVEAFVVLAAIGG